MDVFFVAKRIEKPDEKTRWFGANQSFSGAGMGQYPQAQAEYGIFDCKLKLSSSDLSAIYTPENYRLEPEKEPFGKGMTSPHLPVPYIFGTRV